MLLVKCIFLEIFNNGSTEPVCVFWISLSIYMQGVTISAPKNHLQPLKLETTLERHLSEYLWAEARQQLSGYSIHLIYIMTYMYIKMTHLLYSFKFPHMYIWRLQSVHITIGEFEHTARLCTCHVQWQTCSRKFSTPIFNSLVQPAVRKIQVSDKWGSTVRKKASLQNTSSNLCFTGHFVPKTFLCPAQQLLFFHRLSTHFF